MNQKTDNIHHLHQLLAMTYDLALKTQSYHWNVTGMHFNSLHAMFEDQYNELAAAIDEIAEHIRVHGEMVDASLTRFAALSPLTGNEATKDKNMVQDLANGHEALNNHLLGMLENEHLPNTTATLCEDRLAAHRKTGWMLAAHVA